jgi:Cof subfamily protein (haloacid dehalogenase superfamily)
MTNLKLICVDMDGTFLNHDMTYNRTRFERLRAIMNQRDIKFAVASGNQYEQLKSFYANPDELIFIAENGTYIKDQHDVLFVSQFEKSDLLRFWSWLDNHPYSLSISTPNMGYVLPHEPRKDYIALYYHALSEIDSFRNITAPVMKLSLIVPEVDGPKVKAQLNALFEGRATAVYSGFDSVDVMVTGINKGFGVKLICERYGIHPDDVVAFGDNDNDVEMLKVAGQSYAMETASPAAKAAAKFIAPANHKDGVNTILEKLLTETNPNG